MDSNLINSEFLFYNNTNMNIFFADTMGMTYLRKKINQSGG